MAEAHQTKSDVTPLYSIIFFSCLLFLGAACGLLLGGLDMFVDTDPLWHLAAGDLIRAQGIPYSDPWSYTTEGYRWLNISWAWDSLLSTMHEHMGWHGAFALNAITIALTLSIIFAAVLLFSRNPITSMATLVLFMPLLVINLRPLQVTALLTAVFVLVLGNIIRHRASKAWLMLLPILSIVWVNCHGGFILAPMLVGAYFLQALLQKDKTLSLQLFATSIFTALALLVNPYGFAIFEAAWRPLMTQANQFIIEWQPLTTSVKNLITYCYIPVFILASFHAKKSAKPIEYALSYFWLFMAFTSMRHMMVFAIISAPITAMGLAALWQTMLPRFANLPANILGRYNAKPAALAGLLLSVAIALLIPTTHVGNMLPHAHAKPASMKTELDFIAAHYPKTRFLIDFDVAAIVVYESRGNVPVFIDPRTETAFPPGIMAEYAQFLKGADSWESILDKHDIGGLVIANETIPGMLDRFTNRKGWEIAFKGPKATIFIRERHEKH